MDEVNNLFKNNNPINVSRNISKDDEEPGTVLQEFYRGATVFVTGATGFMGKVLIEKLLRSCPNIARIYLLIRIKKGRSAEERIDDLASSPCFSNLFLQCPKLKSKLVAIGGDISLEGLGISDVDRRLLNEHVSVVFHLAATVRFDQQLKVAINQNVKSTREIMTLCKTFDKLKAAIYVSTAYSNCPSLTIKECLYDPPIPCMQAIEMAGSIEEDLLDTMTPSILGKWPNTYSFSKAIAEDAVRQYGQGLPVGVYRPSIVACSLNEPMPGWTDTLFGPMGLSMGMGAGVMRTMHMDADVVCNVVPCDMAINCLIAAAWDVAERGSTPEIPVYNFVTPKGNEHSWRDGYNQLSKQVAQTPISTAMWHMSVVFTASKLMATIYKIFLHFLPAFLLDCFLVVTSRKPRMVEIYKKIHKVEAAYLYFNTKVWSFEVKNVQGLWQKLTPRDQSIFDFDMLSLEWDTFYMNAWMGIRTFLAKDSVESIPAARAKSRKLYWLHRITQCLLLCMSAYLCWTVLSAVLHRL